MDRATLLVVQKSTEALKMLGAVGGFVLVSFLPFCDLENQIWVEERWLYFPKKLKC